MEKQLTLKEYRDKFVEIYRLYNKETVRVIDNACEKLIIGFKALEGRLRFPIIDMKHSPDAFVVNLKYACKVGIRYCGQFVNMIKVSKDEDKAAIDRITLTYVSYEDKNDDSAWANCFPDDGYFGEEADDRFEDIPIARDWENFMILLKSLEPFFANAGLSDIYEVMRLEINCDASTLSKLDDELCQIQEDIDDYFMRVLDYYGNSKNKIFVMLPYYASIRYKGKFHNCITIDNHSVSLGYIQYNPYAAEEGYYQDLYTVDNDFGRYMDAERKLLHEVSLNFYLNGHVGFIAALDDLIFLCGENLERLTNDNFSSLQFVEYIHTKLTD